MCGSAFVGVSSFYHQSLHTSSQFGYFSRCLEAECGARGIALGSDSEALIQVADALAEDELKAMCSVQTADGWYSAVSETRPHARRCMHGSTPFIKIKFHF